MKSKGMCNIHTKGILLVNRLKSEIYSKGGVEEEEDEKMLQNVKRLNVVAFEFFF